MELVALAFQYGFPAGIAVYVLVRIEPRLSELKDAINGLAVAVATCPKKQPR